MLRHERMPQYCESSLCLVAVLKAGGEEPAHKTPRMGLKALVVVATLMFFPCQKHIQYIFSPRFYLNVWNSEVLLLLHPQT